MFLEFSRSAKAQVHVYQLRFLMEKVPNFTYQKNFRIAGFLFIVTLKVLVINAHASSTACIMDGIRGWTKVEV